MKKYKIFIFVLIAGLVLSQGRWKIFDVLTPEAATIFYILGTEDDTSEVFDLFPYITAKFFTADTAGTEDSVSVIPRLQTCSDTSLTSIPDSLKWITAVSYDSLTGDSTVTQHIITNTAIPNDRFGRWILDGQETNSKETPSLVKIQQSNYAEHRGY